MDVYAIVKYFDVEFIVVRIIGGQLWRPCVSYIMDMHNNLLFFRLSFSLLCLYSVQANWQMKTRQIFIAAVAATAAAAAAATANVDFFD